MNIVLLEIIVEILDWTYVYFTLTLICQIQKFPAPTERATIILIKVKPCN